MDAAKVAVNFHWYRWDQLTPDLLYAFLKLRSDIFVVEQNCVFSEMDGIDPQCEHLCALDPQGRLLGYLRLVPPGVQRGVHSLQHGDPASTALPAGPSIGRVVVASTARGTGLGRRLMLEGMRGCAERHAGADQYLAAQQQLVPFYAGLGFSEALGAPYLEDGIWHVNLRRPAILGA